MNLSTAILQDPHPTLRARALEVVDFPVRAELVDTMVQACTESGGAGLAANQIGVLERVILIEHSCRQFMVNPVIKSRRGEQRVDDGCLSVAAGARRGVTLRASEVYVEFQDLNGEPRKALARGLRAAIVQHEVDHLDGILWIDKAI